MFGRSFGVFAAAAILGLSVLAYSDGTGSSVIYVNASATGANTGESWDNAFTSLQSALDAAISGCEIWVAEGTYKPSKEVDGTGARYRTFQLQNEVGLYGGFKGNEISRDLRNWEVNKTILSGDLNGNGKDNNDAYHVFYRLPKPGDEYINTSAVLDGFVISGGNANGAGFHGCGGGMYNSASGPTISNCTFVNNSAIFMGGAICNENASHSTIINCIFRNNTAENGGGILNSSSGIVVTDCTFANNSATKNGGGIDSRIPQQDIPFA
ncbi:MAG TPA: right-handed parallel beta-helix repeat-containing protein [Anaerohalosphaeraceae bacterium]|nr:right-handed parallel beta-helix repeat-containing protein [Anaerohalosphaeraceae bacterium]